MSVDASDPLAAALAVAIVVVPWWTGWRVARDLTGAARWGLAVAPPVLAVAGVRWGTPWDVGDPLIAACAWAVGVGSARLSGEAWARAAGALGLFVVVAEVGTRLLLPPFPAPPPGWQPQARMHTDHAATACALAFPESPWGPPRPAPPSSDGRPAVLHLGDSMLVFGPGHTDRRTVDRLQAADPERQHVRLAVPGTAVGVHLALLDAWIDRYPTERVVLYVFLGNDLADGPRPPACCEGEDDVRPCGAPALPWWSSLLDPSDAARTALPLVWVVGRHHSRLLREVTYRWRQAGGATFVDDEQLQQDPAAYARALEGYRDTLGVLVDLASARGAAVEVVVLPFGPDMAAWSRGDVVPSRARAEDVVATARSLGAVAWDVGPAFLDAPGSLYLSDGHHLDADGHRLLAERVWARWATERPGG